MNSPASTDAVLFRTEGLSKLYPDGQVWALRKVATEIRRGEYVAVMGPSGSGKSTLLNVLGGLDRPTEGEVYFDGEPLGRMRSLDRYRCEKIGFVFQSFHLLPVLTSLENVQVPMFETQRPVSDRVVRARELLELVGMAHRMNHLPKQLSVGERQRVAIARALANDPAVLLADEPTGNLDTTNAASILDVFAELHAQRGMTIVMVTHDSNLAGRAQRVIRMQDGQVVSNFPIAVP
jgi:ABC-type lipoprotein export system ATPase subunit